MISEPSQAVGTHPRRTHVLFCGATLVGGYAAWRPGPLKIRLVLRGVHPPSATELALHGGSKASVDEAAKELMLFSGALGEVGRQGEAAARLDSASTGFDIVLTWQPELSCTNSAVGEPRGEVLIFG